MKKNITLVAICLLLAQIISAQSYTPTAANLAARREFQDNKYGMFIHWGLSSVLEDGEWVMNIRNMHVDEYKKLLSKFNSVDFDAAKWVATAKNAGMKYIVFITRHHDGFSNWDTKYSDWKITNTPYGKDVLKMLAAECQKQGMKLGLYYSLVDWSRSDYPYETGRSGQGTGRTEKSDYASYLAFMKNQLTELLTNYGDIMSIWFDGHWDQTNPEGAADRTSRIDWKYDELYSLIHRLQPACLIGNNHHLAIIPGEDFQMFERDLPGQNNSGLSFQHPSDEVPLETCETINGAWGYNAKDHNYKTVRQIINLLMGAAGRNANLLLNVGPRPTGVIQSEFSDTLAAVGKWLERYGESIYGTRSGPSASMGLTTQKDKYIYLYLMQYPKSDFIILYGDLKIKKVTAFATGKEIKFGTRNGKTTIPIERKVFEGQEKLIRVELK